MKILKTALVALGAFGAYWIVKKNKEKKGSSSTGEKRMLQNEKKP